MRYLLFLFPFLTLFCKNQPVEGKLLVNAPTVGRAAPNERSEEIASFKKGSMLTDLGEVSHTESRLRINGALFQTPWIKVQVTEKQSGWVFAGALNPPSEQHDWLLQKRLECYFGKAIARRRNQLLGDLDQVEDDVALAFQWRKTNGLRDTLLYLLARRPETDFEPDFSWLSDVLPGFIYQKLDGGAQPGLFADYRFWLQKAARTRGDQDDQFLQTCILAFPVDSIASFFPSWKFQLSDNESASQLGAGPHLKILQRIDQLNAKGNLFSQDLALLEDLLLDDIFGKNVRYWQPKERILQALEAIRSHPPKCLSARDLEQLDIRAQMFQDPEANGIVVNLRSGGG